jgi:hypothetical protein
MIKLLEQIPIWKSLVGLPKRIAELEQRVAALETLTRALIENLPRTPGTPGWN